MDPEEAAASAVPLVGDVDTSDGKLVGSNRVSVFYFAIGFLDLDGCGPIVPPEAGVGLGDFFFKGGTTFTELSIFC